MLVSVRSISILLRPLIWLSILKEAMQLAVDTAMFSGINSAVFLDTAMSLSLLSVLLPSLMLACLVSWAFATERFSGHADKFASHSAILVMDNRNSVIAMDNRVFCIHTYRASSVLRLV